MRITASRKDEILKRKAKYDKDYAEYRARQKDAESRYYADERAILQPIKEEVLRIFEGLDLLDVKVDVRPAVFTGHVGVNVSIRCSCGALQWNYEVDVDSDGNIKKSTSSWSGMSATTADEIDSLKQTVDALERLAYIEWESVVLVDLPDWYDYFDLHDIPPEEEDFDAQLQEAEIEELIGQDKLLKVHNWDSSPYWGQYLWLRFTGQTPAYWKIDIISDSAVEANAFDDQYFALGWKVKKTTLKPVEPFEIKEIV